MEKYIQQFSNTILNLFFDQSNYLTNKIEINSDSQLHYVKEAKKEQSLLVQIFLNSKNPSFNRKHQIMLLEISHQNKTSNYEGFQQFDDFINDDPQNLQQNLNMVLKLIISMSFLSPYINFSNNKYSQKITLIRKKYIMDYSVSYQQNFETMKEKKLKTQNTDNVYSIKKVIENSKEIILVNYQIADNLNEIVQLIQQNEVLKSKSSKGLRNRFLSEETGYEIYENNLRKVRAAQRFRSSLSIKQIDKKTHLLSQILINKKPYELVDEVILKNTLNEQNENEASLFIRHPNEVEFDLKSPEETNNSSSFFTDTNFSIRSKNKEQSVQKTDLNDFDQIPTTENIYYIFKETGKAFRKFQFQQNNEKQKQDQTYTCKGNKRKQIVFRFGNQKALNFDFYVLNFFSINQQFKMRRVVQQNIADLSFYEQCQNTTKLDSQKFTDIKIVVMIINDYK